MRHAHMLKRGATLALMLGLVACAQHPAPPAGRGYFKVGKPYQVKGVWYTPVEDYNYDETGIGSWYGPGFHGKATANGETYDENELTAAHKTLQMPALVRVTNLDNGRSIVVRLNDRGPYVNNRIIDMSRRGAQLLGYERTGTAKVRVQVLGEESRQVAAAARQGALPPPLVASLDTAPGAPGPTTTGPTAAAAPVPAVSAPVPLPGPALAAASETVPDSLPGAIEEGRFMPAPVVVDLPLSKRGQIYVQAGAFGQMDNAQRARQRLESFGPATISRAMVGGRQLMRVRLGPLASVEQADSALGHVIQSGLTDAKIVVE